MIYAFGTSLIMLAGCSKETNLTGNSNNNLALNLTPLTSTSLSAPINEAKVYKLLKGYDSSNNFEASGVKYVSGYFYAIFDNMFNIGKFVSTLPINSSSNSLSSGSSSSSNFEAITYDSYNTPNFYVADENESHNGEYSPKIYEYDASLNEQSTTWAPYSFSSADKNKGFEGLTWIRRNNNDYLLGLCERTGKIIVMEQSGSNWVKVDSISMPAGTGMTDFSDIDISSSLRVGVTSQESSLLWIGQLSATSWTFVNAGTVYSFPTGDQNGNVGAGGYVLYGNVEGVSFITDTQVVVCSDKAGSDQPSYQSFKAQTISIFNLPQ